MLRIIQRLMLDKFCFSNFKIRIASNILRVPNASELQYTQASQKKLQHDFALLNYKSHQVELLELY